MSTSRMIWAGGITTAVFLQGIAFAAEPASAVPAVTAGTTAKVPSWTYEALRQLEDAGYIVLPENLQTLSREETAHVVSLALGNMEQSESLMRETGNSKGTTKASSAAKVEATSVRVVDAEELAQLRQEAERLGTAHEKARRAYKKTLLEEAAYASSGQNLSVLTRLGEKRKTQETEVETTAGTYGIAMARLHLMELRAESPVKGTADAEQIITLSRRYGRAVRLMTEDEVRVQLMTQRVSRMKAEQPKVFGEKSYPKTSSDTDVQQRSGKSGQQETEPKDSVMKVAEQRLGYAGRMLEATRRRVERLQEAMTGGMSAGRGAFEGNSPEDILHVYQGSVTENVYARASRLRTEFADELAAIGYFATEAATDVAFGETKPAERPMPRLLIDGEARFDYNHHTNVDRLSSSSKPSAKRGRFRLRTYADYNIDNNWHAKGMLEYQKAFTGSGDRKDGRPVLERLYLEGRTGTVLWDAGAFGTLWGEGNIYDSKFKGVRASAGDPVKYTVEAGRMKASNRVYGLTASYRGNDELIEGGVYHARKVWDGPSKTIYMLNYRRPVGVLDFGLMLLRGSVSEGRGSGTGYVLTVSHGREDNWRPGSSMKYIKYYYQPEGTYIGHTMNGLADTMGGFRGVGLGWVYTLQKDLVLNLEFDRLKDLTTKQYCNTIWGSLTYYFRTYSEE